MLFFNYLIIVSTRYDHKLGSQGGQLGPQPATIKFLINLCKNQWKNKGKIKGPYTPMFSTLGWVVLVYPYFGRQGGSSDLNLLR